MKPRIAPLLLALIAPLAWTACGAETSSSPAEPAAQVDPPGVATPGAPSPEPATTGPTKTPVGRMYDRSDALLAREESGAATVRVQNLLVGVRGPKFPGLNRSMGDAEVLTAELIEQIDAGADFDDLIRNHSSDTYPGYYTLITEGQADDRKSIFLRSDVAEHFANVSFRLRVDEIGIAPYAPNIPGRKGKSPYGFHIVKRIE